MKQKVVIMRGFALLCLGFALFAPATAQAAMVFCNRMTVPIEAALGYRADGQWASEGWWQVPPNKCVRVIAKPLSERFYFYLGRTLQGEKITWGGKYMFCTDERPFKIVGDLECDGRGYFDSGFAQIETGEQKSFTLEFK
jgi:uncharacterized membrane protein